MVEPDYHNVDPQYDEPERNEAERTLDAALIAEQDAKMQATLLSLVTAGLQSETHDMSKDDTGILDPGQNHVLIDPAVSHDAHLQPEGQKWAFDSEVTKHFQPMIEASIPGYHDMRALTFKLGSRFLKGPGAVMIDIGSSRGDSLAPFVDADPDNNYTAIECSPPMLEVLRSRFAGKNVDIVDHDLRTNLSAFETRSDLILDSLSLMFVPIEHRFRLCQAIYDSLKPGGAFISIQKTLGADSYTHDLLDAAYLDMKREHGYTHEQIIRKKLSLEGVLVPLTTDMNESMFRRTGFRRIEMFWKSLQFCGWICAKD